MAIAPVGQSAVVSGSTNASTVDVPDGSIGDFLVYIASWGTSTAVDENDRPVATNVPPDFTHLGTAACIPDSETWGIDTGLRFQSIWVATATSSSGSDDEATFTLTGSGTDRVIGVSCYRFSKASDKAIEPAVTFGIDTTKATSWNAAGLTDVGAEAGDVLLITATVIPDSVNLGQAITWAGCTLSAFTNSLTGAVTNGNDVRQNSRVSSVTAGTSSAAPALTSGTTGAAGIGSIVRLREGEALPPVPVMNAGPDQTNIAPGQLVTLDSSGSINSSSRTWTQISGEVVTLSDITAIYPTFNAPSLQDNDVLVFRVTDDTSGNYDEVSISVLGYDVVQSIDPDVRASFDDVAENTQLSNTHIGVNAIPGNAGDLTGLAAAAIRGVRGIRVYGNAVSSWFRQDIPSQPVATAQQYFKVENTPPAANLALCSIRSPSATAASAILTTANALHVQDASGSNRLVASGLSAGWYVISLAAEKGTTTSNGHFGAWLRRASDDSLVVAAVDKTDANTGVDDYTEVRHGKTGAGGVITYDMDECAAGWSQWGETTRVSFTTIRIADIPESVEPGSIVELDSSESSGVLAGRTWTQTEGAPVTLSSTTAEVVTFEAPYTIDGTVLEIVLSDDTSGEEGYAIVDILPASRRVMFGGSMHPVQRRIHL